MSFSFSGRDTPRAFSKPVVIHELPHFDQIPDTQKHLGLVNDVCHRLKNLTYQFGMSLMTGIYAQNGIPCGTDSRGP